jgi:16S rRNA (cytosine1402-N4)-methyltransferase
MAFQHEPVMPQEVIEGIAPEPGGRYVDGTLGGGGHARLLLEKSAPGGMVLGLDQDPDAVAHAWDWAGQRSDFIIRQANFSEVDQILDEIGWKAVNGMILDLGLSSHQLEASGRGFSFGRDESLDMRMDPDGELTAADIVNRWREAELADLIYQYGEERASRRVARAIVYERKKARIRTSAQLADIVRRAKGGRGRREKIDPATRTFQALRLAVNRELDHLEDFLAKAPTILKPGGRLAVISFHSLEDRLVKRAFIRRPAKDEPKSGLLAITKKPIRPTLEEVERNPRSRSAKLRVGERVT